MQLRHFMVVSILTILTSSTACAGPITSAEGLEGLGSFTALLDYKSYSATSGQLTVSLTNTSPAQNGGCITNFHLNNPGNQINAITGFTPSDADFILLGLTDDGIKALPFGYFDFGTELKSSKPSYGIGNGDTGSFVFSFSGTGLDTLSTCNFMGEYSANRDGNKSAPLLVRFQGLKDGGSDKVPAYSCAYPNPVPEPSSLILGGSALAGALASRRRKR